MRTTGRCAWSGFIGCFDFARGRFGGRVTKVRFEMGSAATSATEHPGQLTVTPSEKSDEASASAEADAARAALGKSILRPRDARLRGCWTGTGYGFAFAAWLPVTSLTVRYMSRGRWSTFPGPLRQPSPDPYCRRGPNSGDYAQALTHVVGQGSQGVAAVCRIALWLSGIVSIGSSAMATVVIGLLVGASFTPPRPHSVRGTNPRRRNRTR